jgi:ubiquinone/menaquinone biosynthesis C-methylase UbiE
MTNAPNWSRATVEGEQRKYYDSIAPVYDQYYHDRLATAYRAWLYDQTVGHLVLRNLKVLDAMCGGGESTAYFLSHGGSVSAQDISQEQCELYRKRYPDCAVERSSILNCGYLDASFDLVVVESLHHLHPYTTDAMHEIARLLKPGGSLLLWEPCSGSIADLARRLWYRLDRRCFLPNEAAINLANLLDASSEFEIVSERYGGNFEFLLVFSSMHLRIPQNFVRYYAPVCHFLEKVMNRLNWRLIACWMLVLLRKRS